ncbi:uncharacterized protein LOC128864983 [Anastrepha ludens]|uniref:uncharacterized protein LOC128864983 n=1 Tax=Anastrepha ludens TaxID=28586 RepID=UPI0023AEAAAC|nr:uncharacterized protein LOC128864983 [Anastrepha ludens]
MNRIWAEEQPEAIQERPLHPLKTTIWCVLWAGGIIGSYLFKDEADANVIVNGKNYGAMINDFSMPEIEVRDLSNLWFQQDGATCHTDRETMNLLRRPLGGM